MGVQALNFKFPVATHLRPYIRAEILINSNTNKYINTLNKEVRCMKPWGVIPCMPLPN